MYGSKEIIQRTSGNLGKKTFDIAMANVPQHTDELIYSHEFSFYEQWLVFIATFITACSFFAVVVVLWKKHKGRGLDIVLIKISALCFLIYRASIAFHLTANTA